MKEYPEQLQKLVDNMNKLKEGQDMGELKVDKLYIDKKKVLQEEIDWIKNTIRYYERALEEKQEKLKNLIVNGE